MGPFTIFDKSALQSLSMDEAVWLDAFFLASVTPLSCVETLADLEKARGSRQAARGRGWHARHQDAGRCLPERHHRSLISAELQGQEARLDGDAADYLVIARRVPIH